MAPTGPNFEIRVPSVANGNHRWLTKTKGDRSSVTCYVRGADPINGAAEGGMVGVTPNLAEGLTFSDLKGIAGPARAWTALPASSVESRFEAALHAAGLTPLVGREEEFELLQRRWREATGSRAPVTAGRYLVQIIHHRGKPAS